MASFLLDALWCVTVDVDLKMWLSECNAIMIFGSRGWVRFPAYLDRGWRSPWELEVGSEVRFWGNCCNETV